MMFNNNDKDPLINSGHKGYAVKGHLRTNIYTAKLNLFPKQIHKPAPN